jgi:DNA-binding SARP family transcriptional activator
MVSITLLGEQSVVDPVSGQTLTRSARSIALLGLLVARMGSPQSRAYIAGAFWPESGESQAMTNLRRELHQLRRWIDDDSLEVTGSHLCWHERGRHAVDLATFLAERQTVLASDDPEVVLEHGLRGLTAYGGDLLPGMEGEWLDQLRGELRTECVRLCDAVTVAARELDRTDVAIDAVRRRVAFEPFDEPAQRRLMGFLVDVGDRAGAVRVYHQLSELLERELGVSPDRQTTEVLARITGPAHDGGDVPPRSARARTGGEGNVVPQRRERATRGTRVVVGREAEERGLRTTWDKARAGAAQVVLVSGPAGVGKSALVDELAARLATERAVVAVGQCFESTGRLPLSPVAAWLRSPAVAATRGTLDAAWQRETERLVPTGTTASSSSDGAGAWQQHRFFEGLARALVAPGRPTLLILDNLQWCDADTLQVLASLLNVTPQAPVLIAVTSRPEPENTGSRTREWLDDLRRTGLLTEIKLTPFDLDRTAELAAVLLGSPQRGDDALLLHDATGGFPLFILEAVRMRGSSSATPGDLASWSDILARRFEQVSHEARLTAELAAALRRDFTLPILTAASELPTDDVVRAVDELWRQRLLRQRGDGYEFSHDLIREAAYASVSPAQRWLLHRRLAEVLEERSHAQGDGLAAQIAEQHTLAGDHERAITWFLRGADAIGGILAFDEILTLMRRGLDEAERLPDSAHRDELEVECRIRTARTLVSLHGYAFAELEPTALRIVELAERLGRVSDAFTGGELLLSFHFVRGRMGDALQAARRTLEDAQAHGTTTDIAVARHHLAAVALHHGECELSDDAWDRASHGSLSDAMVSFHTRADVFLPAWRAHAAWIRGRNEQAATLAEQALGRATATGHVPSRVVALAYGAITAQLLADRDECARRAEALLSLCTRYHMAYYEQFGRILGGWCRGVEACAEMEAALVKLRENNSWGRMPYWLSLLADVSPQADQAAGLLEDAVRIAEAGHEHLWLPELWRRQADLEGNDAAAAALRVRARDLAVEQGNVAMRQRVEHDLEAATSFPNGSRTLDELGSSDQGPPPEETTR